MHPAGGETRSGGDGLLVYNHRHTVGLRMAEDRNAILRQLRFVVAAWREDARSDVELLNRFVQDRDERAFGTLVGRHGGLVWGICSRILGNRADAEDAFQATFMRLARDADRILSGHTLAGWLFRAARCSALDLRRSIARHRRIEERLARAIDEASPDGTDVRLALDDELDQLPEQDRAVLVLCHLEGRTYAETALELGCSVAAVHRRLTRAQDLLRKQLARHGRPVLALLAGSSAGAASAATPCLLARTVDECVGCAARRGFPDTAAGLLAGGLHIGTGARVPTAVKALGVVAVGLAVLGPVLDSRSRVPTPATQLPAAGRDPEVLSSRPGSRPVVVSGTIHGPDGKPVPGAAVAALARRPYEPGARGMRDAVVASTRADSAGRFDLPVPTDFPTWFAERVVTVRATAPGLAPVTRTVSVGSFAGGMSLRLGVATPLRGRLLDPDGRPAVGVAVRVVRVGDVADEPVFGRSELTAPDWPVPVVTGADGAFVVPGLGEVSNVWVRVADPRYALDTFRVDRAARLIRLSPVPEYRLSAAQTLEVEVRAADTDRPLPGARLTILTGRLPSHAHFCDTRHGVAGARSVEADETDVAADGRGVARIGLPPGEAVELNVHPPGGEAPYVGVRRQVALPPEVGSERVVVRLPRGRWVRGTVRDETGRPLPGAVVHWGRENASLPEWKDEVLVGRDALTRTGADGRFRIAVLPGPCSVRAYGPTLDYLSVSHRLPGTKDVTLFAHHVERLEVPERGTVPDLDVRLTKGRPVAARVESPDGAEPSPATFLLRPGLVSPVRGYAALPLPIRGGDLTVPDCRAGQAHPVHVLDPSARTGGVFELSPDDPPSAPLRLAPCGRARVRCVGPDGTPAAGRPVAVYLLLGADRQSVEWFDPVNYPRRPRTDADGATELPALIPGARYLVAAGPAGRRAVIGPFAVRADETIELPTATLPAAAGEQEERDDG